MQQPISHARDTGRLIIVASALLLTLLNRASATWSILMVDQSTQVIGIAGASCTYDVSGIAGFVPGKGAVISQSIGNQKAKALALEGIREGAALNKVLNVITAPTFDMRVQEQQYALITVTGEHVQFTGLEMGDHYAGERADDGVLVQGNDLAGAAVLDRTMEAVLSARKNEGPMEEILIAGLLAGSEAGGDIRCGSQRATSAFLMIVKPGDLGSNPYLYLAVFGVDKGGVNAVEVLRSRVVRWQTTGAGDCFRSYTEWVQPN